MGFVALDEVAQVVAGGNDNPLSVQVFLKKSVQAMRMSGGLRVLNIVAPSPMVAMRLYHGLFVAVEHLSAHEVPTVARRRGGVNSGGAAAGAPGRPQRRPPMKPNGRSSTAFH